MNGLRLTVTNDEAYHFIIEVASGQLDDVPAIASALRESAEPR